MTKFSDWKGRLPAIKRIQIRGTNKFRNYNKMLKIETISTSTKTVSKINSLIPSNK